MLSTLPQTSDELKGKSWADLQPFYDELEERTLSAETIHEWLADFSHLSDLVEEHGIRAYVATSRDTTDTEAAQRYQAYVEQIEPQVRAADQRLKLKLLHSSFVPEGFEVALRNLRADVDLFREANLPLLGEEAKLRSAYFKLTGAQTVMWDGEEKTIPQLELMRRETDRDLREHAWKAISQRQLADRDVLNDLWKELLTLRRKIAANADKPDYRAYAWMDRQRFDYTPEDSLRFLDSIAEVVVPAASQLYERRQQQLGVETLRPWDLAVDPLGREPLRPFTDTAELESRVGVIFEKLDPQLGEYFAIMRREDLLDLDNRKGKAPGGYCTWFPLVKRPFVFMNSVGLHNDVLTLIHESGHAFHTFEKLKLPYMIQRTVTSEFNEVASMAMELLTTPYWSRDQGGFYSPAETARACIDQLEKLMVFWPFMAVIDAFQHWVYTHPDDALNPDACDAQWSALRDQYMPAVDFSGLEADKADGWRRIMHIYCWPFYIVEYGMAQLGAVQIWANMLQDQPAALAAYRRGLALGGTKPLPELFATAGATFKFDRETLGAAVNLIMKTIGELEQASEQI
ncbi:MAG: M3 family oligoendopeptidase [Chloroflexi bacterium]|nr:M3 family oligoendopeptidase [Chloroflexota bacterium]